MAPRSRRAYTLDTCPRIVYTEIAQPFHKEYRKQSTKEGVIARDADILECLIQAKEYHEHGYKEAVKFMKKAPSALRTKSARKLWSLARRTNLNEWWERLSKFER